MKKILKQCMLIVVVYLSITVSIHAQQNKQAILDAVKQIQDTYAKANMLSADIRYYYMNETKPSVILDSVKGNIVLNGKSYILRLDSTEVIVTGKYSISLFKEDKLMYLNLPSASAIAYSPLAALDTLFTTIEGIKGDIKDDGRYLTIAIVFPQGLPYKQLVMVADKNTGYVVKVAMVLKTTFMTPSMREADLEKEGYDKYALITTIYSDYKRIELPENFFDENRFFRKNGGEYNVTEQYKDYKIFLGSPNL